MERGGLGLCCCQNEFDEEDNEGEGVMDDDAASRYAGLGRRL